MNPKDFNVNDQYGNSIILNWPPSGNIAEFYTALKDNAEGVIPKPYRANIQYTFTGPHYDEVEEIIYMQGEWKYSPSHLPVKTER
jgi:hypothetical protein